MDVDFQEDEPRKGSRVDPEQLIVDLGAYEGPIDVLLQLARDQKVDVLQLSIRELADQYLTFIQEAQRLKVELAADYLVMASWLAYLKSRLILPQQDSGDDEEPSGADMAAALRFQMQRLEAMQNAGQELMKRPRLGINRFVRGEPGEFPVTTTSRVDLSFYELLQAYANLNLSTWSEPEPRKVDTADLYSVEDAVARIRSLAGRSADWCDLHAFIPSEAQTPIQRRSAIASTLMASLEMVRDGSLEVHQDDTFGPVRVRAARHEADPQNEPAYVSSS